MRSWSNDTCRSSARRIANASMYSLESGRASSRKRPSRGGTGQQPSTSIPATCELAREGEVRMSPTARRTDADDEDPARQGGLHRERTIVS